MGPRNTVDNAGTMLTHEQVEELVHREEFKHLASDGKVTALVIWPKEWGKLLAYLDALRANNEELTQRLKDAERLVMCARVMRDAIDAYEREAAA